MYSLFKEKRFIILITLILFHSAITSCEKEILEDPIEEKAVLIPSSDELPVFFESDSLKVLYFNKMEDWHNMQGGEIYKDKLVCLMATDEMSGEEYNGFIYDIITGKKVSNLLFLSTIGDRTFAKPHANQVSFGSKFYSNKSAFPLLYVSQVNGGTGVDNIFGERGVLVYDISKDSEDKYNVNLVQAIIPDLEDEKLMEKLGKYTPNYIVDNSKDQLVVIGYPFNSWFKLDAPQPVAIFPIPDISNRRDNIVVFNNQSVLDSYCLNDAKSPQQSFILGTTLYSSGGASGQGTIRFINLSKKNTERTYNLAPITRGEPQFFGMWRERFLYYEAGNEGQIFEFIFCREEI